MPSETKVLPELTRLPDRYKFSSGTTIPDKTLSDKEVADLFLGLTPAGSGALLPKHLTRREFSNVAWDLAGLIPGIGAIRSLKKLRPLYHGTREKGDALEIARVGLTKGKSSEIGTPGSSVTEDPSIALAFASGDVDNILRITPELPLKDIVNLTPQRYLLRENILERGIIRKPNILFGESETFGIRSQGRAPFHTRFLSSKEKERLQSNVNKLSDYENIFYTEPGRSLPASIRLYRSIQGISRGAALTHRKTLLDRLQYSSSSPIRTKAVSLSLDWYGLRDRIGHLAGMGKKTPQQEIGIKGVVARLRTFNKEFEALLTEAEKIETGKPFRLNVHERLLLAKGAKARKSIGP